MAMDYTQSTGTDRSRMRASEEAAEKAAQIFQDAFGFSLTDDEQFELVASIYRVFNAASKQS